MPDNYKEDRVFELLELKQTSGVAEYTDEFLKLSLNADFPNNVLAYMYLSGYMEYVRSAQNFR